MFALATLAGRRLALTARTPRQIVVPLLPAVLFGVFMYGLAETLASRVPQQEEYIAATPVVAVLPWFFAGALFPIAALPGALTAFAKVLPLTHALALMRYGLIDPKGSGLHDYRDAGDATTQALLSLAVVAVYALALGTV